MSRAKDPNQGGVAMHPQMRSPCSPAPSRNCRDAKSIVIYDYKMQDYEYTLSHRDVDSTSYNQEVSQDCEYGGVNPKRDGGHQSHIPGVCQSALAGCESLLTDERYRASSTSKKRGTFEVQDISRSRSDMPQRSRTKNCGQLQQSHKIF